jgi:hypothetical protein
MNLLYQFTFVVGILIAIAGAVPWAKAGFPVGFNDVSAAFFGGTHWHLNKESCIFIVFVGLMISAYSAIELNLKRWQRK